MLRYEQQLADGRVAHLRFSDVADGDFAIADPDGKLAANRTALCEYPWTWLHQVHGADVVHVTRPGEGAASEADASFTAIEQSVVAVQTADCVPVLFVGSNGMVAAAHAGWRGAVAGVLPATVERMRAFDGGDIAAIVGPAIGPECYEFGRADLDVAEACLGPVVRGETRDGSPALDLVAGVRSQLASLDVETVVVEQCTACSPNYNSHRARVDKGRQVAAAWIDSTSLGHPSP